MTEITMRRTFRHGFPWSEPVADFSGNVRPAFRVACHCRNCSWKAEARFKVGTKIPMWELCPQCGCWELSCHGDFRGRDTLTLQEEEDSAREAVEHWRERRETLR